MTARLDSWPEPPEPEDLRRLRTRLLQSTRGAAAHIPSRDAEDVVQNAMVRFLRETPRPGAPSDDIRGHVALKRERANYYRSSARRPERLTDDPAALRRTSMDPDHEFVESRLTIEQIAGPDAAKLADVRGKGYSLTDAARVLHWDARRVEAARKQLERYAPRIARAVRAQLKEDPDGA